MDLSHLNPEQRRAVEITEGPLLVLAGAGSGKTRVVVHRIAWMLQQGVSPESILAVTFTNKAAAEMRERVARLTRPSDAERLTVSTFHAFGLTVLKEHIAHLGFRSRFAIFDTQDQLAVVRRVLSTVSLGRDLDQKRLLAMISRAKNAGIGPEAWEAQARPDDDYEVMLCEVYGRYQRALRAMNAVDFDDLILLPLTLLREHPEVREAFHARYRYLMVDEYQDTSKVQVQLLQAMAAASGNVCVVGDDDQSIYAWRGAEVGNILHFEDTFPGAKEVKLTRNYRSTAFILQAANAVIAKNTDRRGKDLWTSAPGGSPIRVVVCPDDETEARWVVGEIQRLVQMEGRSYDDVAILFRTNGQAQPFEEELRANHIDHKIVGGTRFFDRKEVRDGIAYLRICVNPRDDVSLMRIVQTPPRGIGDTTLERLGEAARVSGASLLEVMAKADRLPEVERATGAVMEFVDLLERHRPALKGKNVGKAAQALFEEAGLFEHVRSSVKSAKAGESRANNLAGVVRSLESFAQREARPSLATWLSRIALDGRDEDEASERGKITLLTLHAAKGLEFPVVFLVGLEEGLLPHDGMQGAAQDLPEERRLAYVGITRAQEHLYLTRCEVRQRRGRAAPRIPSRFLEDLPEGTFTLVDAGESTFDPESDVAAGKAFLAQLRSRLGQSG